MHVHCSSVFVLKHTAQMSWDQSLSLFKCKYFFKRHFLLNFVHCGKYYLHLGYFILCSNRKGAFSFISLVQYCPHSRSFLPFLPVALLRLKLEGIRHLKGTCWWFFAVTRSLDSLRIESKLIGIIRV